MPAADENVVAYSELDDAKFVKSREVILELLLRLFPDGSSRWSRLSIVEHLIDQAVGEIAHVWLAGDDEHPDYNHEDTHP